MKLTMHLMRMPWLPVSPRPPDAPYTQLLADAGYDVQRYLQTGTPDVNVVNAADLVIISRSVSSGSFSGDGATAWNTVTAPMIVVNGVHRSQ